MDFGFSPFCSPHLLLKTNCKYGNLSWKACGCSRQNIPALSPKLEPCKISLDFLLKIFIFLNVYLWYWWYKKLLNFLSMIFFLWSLNIVWNWTSWRSPKSQNPGDSSLLESALSRPGSQPLFTPCLFTVVCGLIQQMRATSEILRHYFLVPPQ